MDLSKIAVFSALTARMRWLNQRQSVIADNVANSDTPDYRPRDLKPLDFRDVLRGTQAKMETARTNGSHFQTNTRSSSFADKVDHRNAETTLTGNAVTLENEMLKVAETAADYRLMTNLYAKQVALLKTVLGRGR